MFGLPVPLPGMVPQHVLSSAQVSDARIARARPTPTADEERAAEEAALAAEAAETDVTELLPLLPLLLPLADPGEAQPWRLCPPSERPELKTAPQLVHANLAPGWCGFAVLSLLAFRIADLGRFV